jgi:hypothetical protein
MTKKQKMYLGGGVLAAVAIGGIYLATKKPIAAVPTPALPSGTPVASFVPGQTYTFVAVLPMGIADAAALAASLKAAGWSGVSVLYFGPTAAGAVPAPLQANTTGYAASGTWNGVATPVPTGVIAVAGTLAGNGTIVASA